METNERQREQERRPVQPAGANDSGENLTAVRQNADGILAAGRAAINRVLSNNSEAFLTANRQTGGQ